MRLIDAGLQDAPQQSVEYFVDQLMDELYILAQGTATSDPCPARFSLKRSGGLS